MSLHRQLFARLDRLREDTRGNVMIMTAAFMTVVLGCLACAVDLGSLYFEKRRAQTAVDLAAMASAQALNNARPRAVDTLTRNRYPTPNALSVETGTYTANIAVPVASRFTAGAAPANAARVTMTTRAPLYFASAILGRDSAEIRTTAVATNSQMAQFSIGTRLAAVNGGIANALLSRTLGTTVSLSVMDYNALAGAKVDVFKFSRALATQLHLQAATFNELANTTMRVSDVYTALTVLARSGDLGPGQQVIDAITRLADLAAGTTSSVLLGKLLSYGPYGNQPVAEGAGAGVNAKVGVLDLATTTAMVANGQRQIQLDLGATIPGLARTVVTLAVGERMVTSPWLTLGGNDAVVRTAQTRVYLDVQVGGSGLLSAATVSIPLYVEVAAGEARLSNLTCGNSNTDTSVTLAVQPTLAEAWLGTVNPAALTNFQIRPTVSRATMVNLSLLLGSINITGSGHVRSGTPTPQSVNFTYDEIQALTMKTVSSTNIAGSLIGSLLGNLDLTVSVLGLGLGVTPVTQALAGVLATALTPIDSVLQSVLELVGVKLGQADVVVNGVRCDGATLAQ
ncbi:MAG TPA: pilus assembly protein TadG-related protein [Vineibacter sp.]|nr:pilus assembly protein TadG-related protein [Vineibacter sp.]